MDCLLMVPAPSPALRRCRTRSSEFKRRLILIGQPLIEGLVKGH